MKSFLRALLPLLFGLVLAPAASAAPPLPRDSVYQLPAALTDQGGGAFRLADLRGRPQVVAMFYTSCRFVCPLIVDSAKGVEHALTAQERAGLGFLLISMDPVRDDTAALRSVADKRGLDPARWRLGRPESGDVRKLAALLGVRYRALADGEFNHTSALVLLDAQGRVKARTERLGAVPDPDFLAAVRQVTNAPVGADRD
jgi:protein SCO1